MALPARLPKARTHASYPPPRPHVLDSLHRYTCLGRRLGPCTATACAPQRELQRPFSTGCGGFSASGRRFPHAPTGTCVHNAPKRRARNGAPQPVDHDDSACAFSDAGDPRPACRLQLDELVHLRRASETPCAQHVRMPRSRCLRSACGRARVARSASARKTGRRSDRPPSHTPRGRRRAPGRSGRCT